MKSIIALIISILVLSNLAYAEKRKTRDISHLISKKEFLSYKDVADFIDKSPKVTVMKPPSKNDIDDQGRPFTTSLTGSDCDRDGKMDDNATCNAVFYKLWLKYAR
ncbi:hypothetical protein [Litorilituus lipolyticus]|uniref:Uncharacterized protein n=1 Tax=Litorilituus lipolyticus TaxID=2491017 RepID=A0A502KYR3_9GAMM|nr:hypothetical protein [Litorilituus lipolyticus]TPH15629.1 hypothetical protein EPA86_08610 [Litorilituus lipolyticus]